MFPSSPGGSNHNPLGSPTTGGPLAPDVLLMAPPPQRLQQNQNVSVTNKVTSSSLFSSSGLTSRSIQTDLSMKQLNDNEKKYVKDLEEKDSQIEDFNRSSEELKRQLQAQQKLIEKQKEQLNKCIDVTKQLLIEKSVMEKKAARQKCMQNRLRLGQFVTQRQGKSSMIFKYFLNDIQIFFK